MDSSFDERRALTTITVAGDIDYATSAAVTDAFHAIWSTIAGRHLLIDLTGVTFFSSAGIQFLVLAQKTAADAGRTMAVITGTNPHVTRPLDLCGVGSAFPTFTSHADAAASGRPG